jgi:hypothetical protein
MPTRARIAGQLHAVNFYGIGDLAEAVATLNGVE